VDLVLDEYVYTDDSRGCQYYFVNHKGRAVFWADKAESDMFPITEELGGIQTKSHIRGSFLKCLTGSERSFGHRA
jgi:hypothetical protein